MLPRLGRIDQGGGVDRDQLPFDRHVQGAADHRVYVADAGTRQAPSGFGVVQLDQVRRAELVEAVAADCRNNVPLDIKRRRCAARGPASAPPLSLGRPARRTPGHTSCDRGSTLLLRQATDALHSHRGRLAVVQLAVSGPPGRHRQNRSTWFLAVQGAKSWPGSDPGMARSVSGGAPPPSRGTQRSFQNRSAESIFGTHPLSGGASAPPPVRNQGPGRSLPGPDAGQSPARCGRSQGSFHDPE
jgi:hypothetical protein